MFATYQYAASSTAANILADVIKILTGETNTANLSANCTTAGTSILTSSTPAGWSVYDASAGTNAQVLRAPWHTDNGSGYNYLYLDVNTAGYLIISCYESWNSSTHVGTNIATTNSSTTANCQKLNVGAGGYLYISATNGHSCVIFSYQAGVWGTTSGGTMPTVVMERTRRSAWDTNTNAYPVVCQMVPTSMSAPLGICTGIPRLINASGADLVSQVGSAGSYFGWNISSTVYQTVPTQAPDATKTVRYLFTPIWAGYPGNCFFGGDCSLYTDMYWMNATANNLDEISYNGNTYVIFAAYVGKLAVRKG